MRVTECLLAAAAVLLCSAAGDVISDEVSLLKKEMSLLKKEVSDLTKQMLMLQFSVEERSRSDGQSGIKIVRGIDRGLKNYESTAHLNPGVFDIHDHTDYYRTIGIGEVSAVMNGVEFRTRHNDYNLIMPSTTSGGYNEWEEIPLPEVPPEVLQKRTIDGQIAEMKEWFKAFRDQNSATRDYTKYFKPVLCYMEGAWILNKSLEESFPSDRHQLNAHSWQDLHNKNRFLTLSGAKDRLENIAFLPTTIMSINNNTGLPEYAQWNYRIICSPINKDIPFSYFQQESDLTYMVVNNKDPAQVTDLKAARFRLFDPDTKRSPTNQILDELFAAIPGKDNYRANLKFTLEAEEMFEATEKGNKLINSGFYHRAYTTVEEGANGLSYAAFGFNDDNMWMAQNTQPNVAPFYAPTCSKTPPRNKLDCKDSEMRVSYAFPMEVVYMTPLLAWNPYNLAFINNKSNDVPGKDGMSESSAFRSTDRNHYYRTPAEFLSDEDAEDEPDPANTGEGSVYVLDQKGVPRLVSSSGTSIFVSGKAGLGKIRLRYPIAPIYGEGSSVWKELNALKDNITGDGPMAQVEFKTNPSVPNGKIGQHVHEFSMSESAFLSMAEGSPVDVVTRPAAGHAHKLRVKYIPETKKFRYTKCDGQDKCWDGHSIMLRLQTKGMLEELQKYVDSSVGYPDCDDYETDCEYELE